MSKRKKKNKVVPPHVSARAEKKPTTNEAAAQSDEVIAAAAGDASTTGGTTGRAGTDQEAAESSSTSKTASSPPKSRKDRRRARKNVQSAPIADEAASTAEAAAPDDTPDDDTGAGATATTADADDANAHSGASEAHEGSQPRIADEADEHRVAGDADFAHLADESAEPRIVDPDAEDRSRFDAEVTVNMVGEDGAASGRDELEPDAEAAPVVDEAERARLQRMHLRGLLEALVFASDSPIKPNELAKLASAPVKSVKELLLELRTDYASRGMHLDEVAGGWVFRTSPQYAPFVRDLTKQKPVRLTRAQVETLAIIAYRQPITRPEIDDVRGVDSGPVLKLLLERDLVRILGKRDEPGRPLIYGTTGNFLEFFGLKSLKDLPTLREFTELSAESREAFEDELGESPDTTAAAPTEGGASDATDPSSDAASDAADPSATRKEGVPAEDMAFTDAADTDAADTDAASTEAAGSDVELAHERKARDEDEDGFADADRGSGALADEEHDRTRDDENVADDADDDGTATDPPEAGDELALEDEEAGDHGMLGVDSRVARPIEHEKALFEEAAAFAESEPPTAEDVGDDDVAEDERRPVPLKSMRVPRPDRANRDHERSADNDDGPHEPEAC